MNIRYPIYEGVYRILTLYQVCSLSQHGIEAGHRLLLSGRNAAQDLHNPEFLKCKTKLKINRYGNDDNSPGRSLPS